MNTDKDQEENELRNCFKNDPVARASSPCRKLPNFNLSAFANSSSSLNLWHGLEARAAKRFLKQFLNPNSSSRLSSRLRAFAVGFSPRLRG